ncbi:MAG: DNA polymerase Y family protein, partial [Alphaproteobacteria bacterium]|nr:DNA polymerase Y family protein [Alphaproteobacteria bacterium]
DTIGAAWAMAHFAETGRTLIVTPGDCRNALAPLPIAALRLDATTVQELRRVGLKRVGDLYAMPRDALTRRFGQIVVQRLDQALDDLPEPLSPLGETPARRVRLSFAEPITDPANLLCATERLVADLVHRLAREGTGARRLDLAFHRVDGRVERIGLGNARPSRDTRHLTRLFKERLETVDPGLGVEDMILSAFAVEPLPAEQLEMPCHRGSPLPTPGMGGGIAPLLDRLGNRLGFAAVSRIEARESHIPERASVQVPISAPTSIAPHPPAPRVPPSPRARGEGRGEGGTYTLSRDALDKPPRPIRLFDPPEPIEAFWLLPDDPPFRFTWRRRGHRVMRADGPERIADEWWRPEASGDVDAIRDYYRVEDEEGRRFWLFRAGLHGHPRNPRWFIHGLFA